MTKKIFVGVLTMGLLVLVICALVFFGLQYAQTIDENQEALRGEAYYAVAGLEMGGVDYLKKLELPDGSPVRITWIQADGSVLYDSDYPEQSANQLENPEVREALQKVEGTSIRDSASSGDSTMYFAIRCPDGTVLRLSRPVSVAAYAFSSVSPVLWVLVLVLLISSAMAFSVARRVVKPINSLNLEDPDPAGAYPEIEPLIRRIHEQQNTIREEAESREAMRKEFSANVSHELKTPLTSISGFAELMRDGMVPPEHIPEFSGDIYRESQRLIALVDDIMRLSRLDEAEGFPEAETVALDTLAEEVCQSLQPIADKRGIEIRQAGTPVETIGVKQVLHEMLFNLVDNAVKYNVDGGKVTVETGIRDSRPYFAVSDTGIGIPESEQERVFERFYRVDKSHSKTIGGTGLGLSIVKHGASYHHATVRLESKVGEGTKVTVSFPKQEKADA
ncbi:MAG: two-component sensor histidine kinase [Clostridia bacterium]|nr:two-component sensor histidine kinase [Clostridia bacterium]